MNTLITGCSGLVGSALVEFLFQQGHTIQCLKRAAKPAGNTFWATEELQTTGFNECNTVIHLAGENVATGRWSADKKKRILTSRVEGTGKLVDYLASQKDKPQLLLCASAVGFYGNRGDDILDEKSSLGEGFLADVCNQWEKESQRATSLGIRVVNLRFGMVLSPRGGALHKMVPPIKARVGGTIGNGRQYISWISIRDLVAIVHFIIGNDRITGPVNVVSPTPTTNRTLTKSLGRALDRPTPFVVPTFVAKLLFGQMAEEMLLSSTRATPEILLESGYEFTDSSLDDVIRFCLGKE